MDKWDKDYCPVCNEIVTKADPRLIDKLKNEHEDKIYRPGEPIPIVIEPVSDARRELEELLKTYHEGKDEPDGFKR